jgi:pilus assembly protein CpaB
MNRRAFLAASILAIVSVTLILLYMRRFERETSGGELIELLVAVKPIKRDAVIKDDMLSTREVPIAYVETRAVRARDRAKVIGLPAEVSLEPQQTLMWTDLAINTEHRDLSSLVQPGKRALTVVARGSSDRDGHALIRPGDYVDVILTLVDAQSAQNQSPQKTSVVLLQRILVLAVGTDTELIGMSSGSASGNRRDSDKALTLSLNLQEVQLLALAIQQGELSVAVRPPDEPTVIDEVPDMKASALLDSRQRSQVQRWTRSARPIEIKAGQ